MKINKEADAVNKLLDQLRDALEGEPFTQGSVEKIQDITEHALVSYSKDDIAAERFLNLNLLETNADKKIRLFIQADIHIEITLRTKVTTDGFQQIETIQDVRVVS